MLVKHLIYSLLIIAPCLAGRINSRLLEGCEVLPPRTWARESQTNNLSLSDELQEILNEGNLRLPMRNHLKSAILILGNTGSGKTTVSLTMNADLANLHAKATRSGKIVIIDDGEKIGLPTTASKALIPEYVLSPDKQVAFYDCPGFDDNRSPAQEIASKYFVKSIMDHLEQVKLLFTIPYSSVLLGGDRNDFNLLVKRASSLIQNMQKFNDSIGLVVTKVPNYDYSGEWKDDDDITSGIEEYLLMFVEMLKDKIEAAAQSKDHERLKLLQRELDFIKILQTTDTNGKLTKISFVRDPPKCGSFKDIPAQLELRKKLTDFYNHSLSYANASQEDFAFSLKPSTEIALNTVVIPAMNGFILDQTNSTLFSLQQAYFNQFNESNQTWSEMTRIEAIEKLDKHLHQFINLLLNPSFQSLQTSKKVSEIYRVLEFSAPTNYLLKVGQRENFIYSFKSFTHLRDDIDLTEHLLLKSLQHNFIDRFQIAKRNILSELKQKINQNANCTLDFASGSRDLLTITTD